MTTKRPRFNHQLYLRQLAALRKLFVGELLFIEVGREQPHDVVAPQLIGPGDQRALSRDFIMLDRLCGADDGGIENLFVQGGEPGMTTYRAA